jgi:hypothetical protein
VRQLLAPGRELVVQQLMLQQEREEQLAGQREQLARRR